MLCAMDPSFWGLYKASWHHHILDNALRIPVCGLIRMVYEMTENWYFLFWVFPNNKKQIDNKNRLVNACTVQICNSYNRGELCCKVSFLVNTFPTNLLVGKFELTLLILIMNLTLKKWSRHACFHKVTRIFLYKIFLISLREILWGWEISLAVSTTNDNFSLKGVGESTFWAVHNHVIANETSLHHLFCAL